MDDGFKYAKKLCEELDIEPTPSERERRSEFMLMDLQMLTLSYKQELTRQMFTSLDKITQEISTRFQQLHELDNQFCFFGTIKASGS